MLPPLFEISKGAVLLTIILPQAFYNFWVNIANFYNTFVTGIAYTGAGWKVYPLPRPFYPFTHIQNAND
jgi:hypothetical protein